MLDLMTRDYTLILDKSGSMSTRDVKGNSRWAAAQESTLAVARKCETLDPDGMTVYTFSGKFRRYESVTADRVAQLFVENEPMGTTNLAAVLLDATEQYFKRKAAGTVQGSGSTILVITDGEPDDRRAVIDVIVQATKKMERDEELAISFIQIGSDSGATAFLKALDDQLEGVGAKFDICDTITIDDMEDLTITEVLLSAIQD